jgi:hypothetical protein
VGAGFAAIGALMLAANYSIGVAWTSDGPQAGYFPFRIGAILVVCGVAAALRTRSAQDAGAAQPFVAPERLRPVAAVALPTVLFVLAMQWLGLYVAALAFIGFFMRAIGGYGWLRTAALGLGAIALLFWTFETQFLIPLPKGPLEAWLGY